MDDIGWKWMKMNENEWKWIKMNEKSWQIEKSWQENAKIHALLDWDQEELSRNAKFSRSEQS